MAVTEFACLRLTPAATLSPALLAKLHQAKMAMEEASGCDFYYYHCIEDQDLIYILGAWPSVEVHMDNFLPGQVNQSLLALLKDEVAVEWMFHLDIDQTRQALPLDRTTPAIIRHFIKDQYRGQFQKTFDENKRYLEDFVGGPEHVVGGYRIDPGFNPSMEGERKEEFVLITGWDSIGHHEEFAKTHGFTNYVQIAKYIEAADIKHAVRLHVSGKV